MTNDVFKCRKLSLPRQALYLCRGTHGHVLKCEVRDSSAVAGIIPLPRHDAENWILPNSERLLPRQPKSCAAARLAKSQITKSEAPVPRQAKYLNRGTMPKSTNCQSQRGLCRGRHNASAAAHFSKNQIPQVREVSAAAA